MKAKTLIATLLAAGMASAVLPGAMAQDKPAPKPRAAMQMDPKLQQQMTDRMKTMQEQMEKIRQTTDPKEREKLLAEHMKSMQEAMQAMRGMGGAMMMGGGMMGQGARGSATQSRQMMEQRMDMMQMMMEQMMQHQQMMQPAPPR